MRIAEAERAKAEAELARSRTDAELAKQRAAALRAERKDTVTRSPTTSRHRRAGKTTRDHSATFFHYAGHRDPPPARRPPRRFPRPPRNRRHRPPPQPRSSQLPRRRHQAPLVAPSLTDSDRGVALRTCEAFEDLRAFSDAIPVRVLNGAIVVEQGHPGKPGYLLISGRPSPDGHLVLSGIIIAAALRYRGQQSRARYEGTYRDGQYELNGFHGKRRCTMTIRMGSQP